MNQLLRQIGNSEIELSALTFGAWGIGISDEFDDPTPAEAIAAIHTAHELGYTSIDTGPLYGLGYSEEVVGKAIRDLPRDSVQLITKCGVTWYGEKGKLWYANRMVRGEIRNIYRYSGKESIISECEASLKRMNTDYIDLYSIHWPDPTTPIEESMEAFDVLKKQGKIRAGGISNQYDINEWEKANSVFDVVSNKIRYSMMFRDVEKSILPFSLANNKSVLAYCVLQRGILTGLEMPQFVWTFDDSPKERSFYSPSNDSTIKKFLGKLNIIASDYGTSLTRLCIKWVVDRPGVAVALLGATSSEQVISDSKAMELKITDGDKKIIDELLVELDGELII